MDNIYPITVIEQKQMCNGNVIKIRFYTTILTLILIITKYTYTFWNVYKINSLITTRTC